MPKSNVKVQCYVDSCDYWENNNLCAAEAIEIDNQSIGDLTMEMGTLGEGKDEAKTSKGTYCRTYKPK
jgi:hypothetical protein